MSTPTDPDWDGTMKARAKEPKDDGLTRVQREAIVKDVVVDIENAALERRIRLALTDEVLDDIDDVALEAANHTQGVWDEVAYWRAWREGIAKKVAE